MSDDVAEYVRRMEAAVARAHQAILKLQSQVNTLEKENAELRAKSKHISFDVTSLPTPIFEDHATPIVDMSRPHKPSKSSNIVAPVSSNVATETELKYYAKLDQSTTNQEGWSRTLHAVRFNEVIRNKYKMPDQDSFEYDLTISDYKDVSPVGTSIKLPPSLSVRGLLSGLSYKNLYCVGRTLVSHGPDLVAKHLFLHLRKSVRDLISVSVNVLLCTSLTSHSTVGSSVHDNNSGTSSSRSILDTLRFPVLCDLFLFIRQRIQYGPEFVRDVLLYLRWRTLSLLKRPGDHTLLRNVAGPTATKQPSTKGSALPILSSTLAAGAAGSTATGAGAVPYDLGDRQELAALWDMDSYCSDDPPTDNQAEETHESSDAAAVSSARVAATDALADPPDAGTLVSPIVNPYASLMTPFPTLHLSASAEKTVQGKKKTAGIDDDSVSGVDDDGNEDGAEEESEEDGSQMSLNSQLVRAWHLFVVLSLSGRRCGGNSKDVDEFVLDVMNIFSSNASSVAPFVALVWVRSETACVISDPLYAMLSIKFFYKCARSAFHEIFSVDSVKYASIIQQYASTLTAEYEKWISDITPSNSDETIHNLCDSVLTYLPKEQETEYSAQMKTIFFDSCTQCHASESSISSFAVVSLSSRILGFWPCVKLLTEKCDMSVVGLAAFPVTVDGLLALFAGESDNPQLRSCVCAQISKSSFETHWKSFFSSMTEHRKSKAQSSRTVVESLHIATEILNTMSHLFRSFLTSEFEPLLNTWRSGESGMGRPMQSVTQTLLDSAQGLVRRICNLSRRPLPSWSGAASTSSVGINMSSSASSSVPLHLLLSMVEFLEFLQARFLPQCDLLIEASAEAAEAAIDIPTLVKLRHVQRDLFGALACVACEQLAGLVVASARSAIESLDKALANANSSSLDAAFQSEAIDFVTSIQRLLIFVPAPWSGKSSSETFVSLYAASRCLQLLKKEKGNKSSSEIDRTGSFLSKLRFDLENDKNTTINTWRVIQSSYLPAFVINLDSRPDRWAHIVEGAERAGLLCVRVRAVDGTSVQRNETDSVPSDDVALMWNSTVHSEYDSLYTADESVAMTPSERACAASHLRTWRWIAHLRQQLFHAPFPSSGRIDAEEMSLSLADSSRLFAACSLGGGWNCTSLGIKSNTEYSQQLQTTAAGANGDWYLIFEDDAHIPSLPTHGYTESEFRTKLAEIIYVHTPPDFDILYLGHSYSATCKTTSVNKVVMKPSYLWSLHAYVLRGSAVNKLLAQLPIKAPVDKFLASLVLDGNLQAYTLKMKLVSPTEASRLSLPNVQHSGRQGGARVRKSYVMADRPVGKKKKMK